MRFLGKRAAVVASVAIALGLAGAASARPRAVSAQAFVVAAEPDAAKAGLEVLKAGGGAIDAAVAVQAVLGLEEPQSSGLSGGAFLVYYDAATRKVTVYNGRETAPASAGSHLFFTPEGKPMGFVDAILSGRSTGVPGAVGMLAKAHADHGKLAWARLFGASERLARDGFKVPPRMAAAMAGPWPQPQTPDAKAYFHKPDGTLYQAGEVMKNPAYAHSIDLIAHQGPDALYKGELMRAIIARTHDGPVPGDLTPADFAAYHPEVMAPLCAPYRQYRICGPAPPAGGVGVLEILGILAHTDIDRRGPSDPEAWRLFAQASRLAYADRDVYEGDPDQVTTPVAGLLDPAYLTARAGLITSFTTEAPAPGEPVGAPPPRPDATREPGGTTHFVIIDKKGDIVSMTTTVESIFGSGRMAGGFFLNNQLTDFSAPISPRGGLAANAPGPGKRPRSSMSPVIVFDASGRPVLAIGSPGGNSIVAYVAKVLVAWIDWKMPLQQAVNLPNVVARGAVVSVEKGEDAKIVAALQAAGLPVRADAGEASGLNGVVLSRSGLEWAVDPRREAQALVDHRK